MKKYILLMLFSTFLFSASSIENIFIPNKEEVKQVEEVNKETDKLIDEVKETPIVLEQKTEIKVNKKELSHIEKDIDADLVSIDNINIDIKNILSNAFIEKEDEIKTLTLLNSIKIEDFSEKYLKDLSLISDSDKKKSVLEKVEILKTKITKILAIKDNLIERYSEKVKLKETVISKTPIENYISILNKEFGNYNKYVKYFGLDAGRVIIFGFSIMGFIVVGYFLNILLKFLFSKLSKVSDDDELENNNFDSIKKPLSFFFFLIGLQVGLEILIYPNSIYLWLSLTFITINTINVMIILNKLVDILLFIISHKRSFNNTRIEVLNLISRGSKILVFLIASIFILSKYGVDTNKILASLGIGSLAVAFASKDIITKFFSGLKLIIDDDFSSGDWVHFNSNGQEGTIIDIGLSNTRVRTFDNALLVIPNSEITESSFVNWNRRKIGRKIGFKIGVKYSSKREDLKNAIIEIEDMLINHPDIAPSEADFTKKKVNNGKLVSIGDDLGLKNVVMVNLSDFNASSIDIDIYAFSKTVVWAEWRFVKQDIMFKIMEILEKHNLEFAFPSQSIYIEKEEN